MGNPMGSIAQTNDYYIHFTTAAENASPVETDASAPDAGLLAVALPLSVLVVLLLVAVWRVFRSVSRGIATHNLQPVRPEFLQIPANDVGPAPFHGFRIIPEEHAEKLGGFKVLADPDAPALSTPKCFVCGRPVDEGDHSHLT